MTNDRMSIEAAAVVLDVLADRERQAAYLDGAIAYWSEVLAIATVRKQVWTDLANLGAAADDPTFLVFADAKSQAWLSAMERAEKAELELCVSAQFEADLAGRVGKPGRSETSHQPV